MVKATTLKKPNDPADRTKLESKQVVHEGKEASKPIGKKHPSVAFALVFGMYPIILIVAVGILLVATWWFYR